MFLQCKLKLTKPCILGFCLSFDLRFHVTLQIQRLRLRICIMTLVIQQFQPKQGEEQGFNLFLPIPFL